MGKPTIISLHIHKTAGSTFSSILDRQYTRDETFYANLIGIDPAFNKLCSCSDAELSKLKVIQGHFPFGWHSIVPNSTYITFLRDPVERVISDYYYNRITPHGHHHSEAKSLSLEEYVTKSNLKNLDNGQTRFISGDFATPFGECEDVMLRLAIDNITKFFSLVCITERFDESLILLKEKFAWKKHIFYVNINKTPKSKVHKEISEKTIDIIKQSNKLDIKLFNYAQELFSEQISAYSGFQADLNQYRKLNHIFQVIHPVYKKLKGLLS